jgi:hypothetical protein
MYQNWGITFRLIPFLSFILLYHKNEYYQTLKKTAKTSFRFYLFVEGNVQHTWTDRSRVNDKCLLS